MRVWIAFWPCVWPINCGSSTRSYWIGSSRSKKFAISRIMIPTVTLCAVEGGRDSDCAAEQYGFEVLPSCRDMTLVALRDQIDENSGSCPPRTMTAISPPATCSRMSRLKKPLDELG